MTKGAYIVSHFLGRVQAAFLLSGAMVVTANAASITIDSVTQRWPWNNKVDITYTVTDGQNVAAGVYAKHDQVHGLHACRSLMRP